MNRLFMLAIAFVLAIAMKAQTLAFPTAEGFGKYASGGRGGAVVEVTNLTDNPDSPAEGSLRWALRQHKGKPLTVVFRVSGIIDLKGHDLRNNRSDITIAGQTAPGDGICIKGGCVNLGGSRNLIIRHIRSRVGVLNDNTYNPGVVDDANFIAGAALNIENGGNFIVDHCSFGWSAEENVGWYDNDHTTVQWCMFEEGLYNAGHLKGNRSYGAVLGGKTATYHHNLLAHNYNRSPRFGSTTKNDKTMLLDFVNNVNYNYGKANACYGGDNRQGDEGLFQLNFVNNYYKPGPAYAGTNKSWFIGASYCNPSQGSQGQSYGKWHLSGNYMDGTWASNNGVNTDNYKGFDISAYTENVPGLTLSEMKSDHLDVGEYAVKTETAAEAYASVLKNVGAFPRDAVDARILKEVETGTATAYGSCNAGRALGIIDKPSDSGGYPQLKTYNEITDNDHDGMDDAWETANGFDPTNPDDRNIVLRDGYTVLEAYLNSLCGETISLEKASIYDAVVAKDGTADYKTIQEAIDAVPEDGKRHMIFVRNGEYNEKVFVGNRYVSSKKIISLIGESREGVIISWDDYHGKSIEYPTKGTISADGMTAPTMTVTAPDFYMENITVRNTVKENVAQAEALYLSGDRQVVKNCNIEGYQDTFRSKKTNRQFIFNSKISGNTDFIYGGGTTYFYYCDIESRSYVNTSKTGGYITAPEDITAKGVLPSTGAAVYYEFFFNDCRLTSDGVKGVSLSRPWADKDCGTVYLNTQMGSHITAEGFAGNGNNTTMCFAEYASTDANGKPIDTSKRISWAQQLTQKDYYSLDMDKIFAATGSTKFDPAAIIVSPSVPANITKDGTLIKWDASTGATGYIIYEDGNIIGYSRGNMYNDGSAHNGTITVRAISAYGGLDDGKTADYLAYHMALNPGEYATIVKEQYTITTTANPTHAGSTTPASVTCEEGTEVTVTATADSGFNFKNWTDANGRVYSTNATYKFNASANISLVANFEAKAKERAYHEPTVTEGCDYEMTYMWNLFEQTTSATSSSTIFKIKNEVSDWVGYSVEEVQTTNRNYHYIDPATDEAIAYTLFTETQYLPIVGAQKWIYLYVKNTSKAKFYFNGSSSTAGRLSVTYTPAGGTATTVKASADFSKNSTTSGIIEVALDPTVTNELRLSATSDHSVWCMKLTPGNETGIQDINHQDHTTTNKRAFNIAGQRVNPQAKGIIIVNGKKWMNKE